MFDFFTQKRSWSSKSFVKLLQFPHIQESLSQTFDGGGGLEVVSLPYAHTIGKR